MPVTRTLPTPLPTDMTRSNVLRRRFPHVVSRGGRSTTADQIMLGMWLVCQMLVCPMTRTVSRRLAEENAVAIADCYVKYPGADAYRTVTNTSVPHEVRVAAVVRAYREGTVHRIRLIAACVKWDLACAAEYGQQRSAASGHMYRRRPFCGPYTAAQRDAQRSLVRLLGCIGMSDTSTATQAAAVASVAELARTHPHAVRELVAAGGVGHVAGMLSHAPDDPPGRSLRLAACKLLHVVAAY